MIERISHHTADDVNIVCLFKGIERYLFVFRDQDARECLRTLGRFASNYDLSFTWFDAAKMSRQIQKIVGGYLFRPNNEDDENGR